MRSCCGWRASESWALLVALALSACASGPSREVHAALASGRTDEALALYERSADPKLLRSIAASVLAREAQSPEASRRARAFAAFERVGRAGEPMLRALAMRSPVPETRAAALALLLRLGDDQARAALLARVNDRDPEVRAAAVQALDPVVDTAALRVLAQAPAAAVRLSAVRQLARAPEDAETRVLLAQAARLDPAPAVRAAALHALAAQGPEGVDAIEARLDDPEAAVRLAAIDELVLADPARASERLSARLAGDPTAEGIESARMLLSAAAGAGAPRARAEASSASNARAGSPALAASPRRSGTPEDTVPSALSQLERALAAPDNGLRAAAAAALMSVRDPRLQPLASARVNTEPARNVRLSLGLALGADRAEGRAVLASLVRAQDVVATEAAAELARHGDAGAVRKLLLLVRSHDVVVRRVAVDALGHDLGRAHAVRASLLDADGDVRIAAACAILASANERRAGRRG